MSSQVPEPFKIQVVDDQTGRGVPLAELRTVNHIVHWTDSQGIVAFSEPGLMDQEVFFHLESPGYEGPKDSFGYQGLSLRTLSGGTATVRLRRTQIAERLYRVTGQGIYRDSLLTQTPVPLPHPVLNGLVLGQDTVIVSPYRNKLYWFWGDTDRPGHPLGNFGASGATSELPGSGGLDPSAGVALTYFTNQTGFAKSMCPLDGTGLRWIEGLIRWQDKNGQEQLLARLAVHTNLGPAREWHLMLFNDEEQSFESIQRWDRNDGHDSSHPFQARVGHETYFYLYPNYRVVAEMEALRDWDQAEAWTCVAGDGRWQGRATEIQRLRSGQPHYRWVKGADRLHPGRLRQLVSFNKIERHEAWMQAVDLHTDNPVAMGRGSVFWNEHRQRWIWIGSGDAGEVWFSEADTPVGPWVYAARVAHHGNYNFYNPTQHPFFDQEQGRIIYFEGTYTAAFTSAPTKTPRYDYNQIMYRLDLADPRLTVPAPVYEQQGEGHGLQMGIQGLDNTLDTVSIPFFALPPSSQASSLEGCQPVYQSADGLSFQSNPGDIPLFFALPPMDLGENEVASNDPHTVALRSSPHCVGLFHETHLDTGAIRYRTDTQPSAEGWTRKESPFCWVWKNPMTFLALDMEVKPVGLDE